jgi:hypothetical protein
VRARTEDLPGETDRRVRARRLTVPVHFLAKPIWLRRHGTVLLLLAALTWGLLWPFSADLGRGLASWGDPVLQYWSTAWTVHALRTDPLDLFNAPIFYPYPNTLAYTDHLFGDTLLALPVTILTGSTVFGFNFAVLLACFLSAVGAYLLVEGLSGSRLAGLAAALPFGFAPYKLANLTHLNVLNSGWIALAIWALIRLWRGGSWRWSALLALAIAFQGLTSIYFFYAELLGLAVTLVYLLLAERQPWRVLARQTLPRLILGAGIGLLALVPFFIPYLQVTRDLGIQRSLDETLPWSADWRFYISVTSNNLFWSGPLHRFTGASSERTLFPGLVAPLLAAIGVACSRRRERWLFVALVVTGVALTLGPYVDLGQLRVPLPYWLLYEIVPGFTALRVPTRFVILALLGLGGLAGFGVEAIARGLRRVRWRPKSHAALLATALLAVLLVVGPYVTEYRTHVGRTGPVADVVSAPVYRWLADHGAGPILELPLPPDYTIPAYLNLTTTVHWRSVIGGNSGFMPPAYDDFQNLVARFPDPAAIQLLQGLGVEQVVVHTADYPAGWEQRAAQTGGITRDQYHEVARFGSDIVYGLAPDPWLDRLVAAAPAGAAVVLPDVAANSVAQELLSVYLRRAGHQVYGSGAIGYQQFVLPADGHLPEAAVLAESSDPYLYGYLPQEAVLTTNGLTLYRRDPAVLAAVMLSDPALQHALPGSTAFSLRLTADRIAAVTDQPSTGGGTSRAALVAFVNPSPGTVTLQFGATRRQEELPAGLVVYQTSAVPTPATIAISTAANQKLYPRWARLLTTSAQPGLVAVRPVVLVDPAIQQTGEATVVMSCLLLPGAVVSSAPDTTPYTVSLDIYQRPFGAHPDGHYGIWTIVVPPGDTARQAALTFDIEKKAAGGTLDGAWTSVASWSGPPFRNGFKASLVVSHGDQVLGSTLLFEFELHNWQARYISLQSASPLFLPIQR